MVIGRVKKGKRMGQSSESRQMTKAERREAARFAAQQEAKLNAARDARSKRIIWSVLGLMITGLIAAVLLVTRPWERPQLDAAPNFPAIPLSEVANVPANTMQEGGFIITPTGGTTSELDPTLPTLGVYFDYMCPACYQFELINIENMRQLAAEGQANVVLHPVAILDHFTPQTHFSTRAVSAAGWVANYAPEHFLDFHIIMFENQPPEGAGDMTNAEMAALAEQVGVPTSVTAGIADGTAAQTFGQWASSLTAASTADPRIINPQIGRFSTPTITLNGERWNGDWSDPTAIPSAILGLGIAPIGS